MSVFTQVVKNALVFSCVLLLPQVVFAGGGGGGGGVRSASVTLSLLPLIAAGLSVGLGVWLRKPTK